LAGNENIPFFLGMTLLFGGSAEQDAGYVE
jgi:hypothetical protein